MSWAVRHPKISAKFKTRNEWKIDWNRPTPSWRRNLAKRRGRFPVWNAMLLTSSALSSKRKDRSKKLDDNFLSVQTVCLDFFLVMSKRYRAMDRDGLVVKCNYVYWCNVERNLPLHVFLATNREVLCWVTVRSKNRSHLACFKTPAC